MDPEDDDTYNDQEVRLPTSSPVLSRSKTDAARDHRPSGTTSKQGQVRSDRILFTPRPSQHRSRTGSALTARSHSRERNPDIASNAGRLSRSRSRERGRERYESLAQGHERTRSRTRSRSSLRNRNLREELELERQRLRVLESQLRNERELRELRERARSRDLELRNRRHSPTGGERARLAEQAVRRRTPDRDSEEARRSMELRDRRRSPAWDNQETGRFTELRSRRLSPGRDNEVRYDSTSRFFEEFLDVMKKQNNKQNNSFPVLNNVIPDFDPMSKEQPITVWLNKVDECSEIYKWNDRQTIHYALPKLVGHAKQWYQGLPSMKRTWLEWKVLLAESFPATENYADLLTEMLAKRARFGESLELYYFSKINLLNRCKIFGKEAIDCLIHGVDDRGVRVGAQAANFEKTEQVLQFFKIVKIPTSTEEEGNSTDPNKDRKPPHSNAFNKQGYRTSDVANPQKPRQNLESIVCFNCKEKGHPCSKCPKPIVKCSYCHLIGHALGDCPKKATKPEAKDKSVMRVLMNENIETPHVVHAGRINCSC